MDSRILILTALAMSGCVDAGALYPGTTTGADWIAVAGSTADVFVPAAEAGDLDELSGLVERELDDIQTLLGLPELGHRPRVFVDRASLLPLDSTGPLLGGGGVSIQPWGRLPFLLLVRDRLTRLLVVSGFGDSPADAEWVAIGLGPYVAGPCSGLEFRKMARLLQDGPGLARFSELENALHEVPPLVAEATAAVAIQYLLDEYGPGIIEPLWTGSFGGLSTRYGLDRESTEQIIDGYVRALDFGERLRITDWTSLTDRCG